MNKLISKIKCADAAATRSLRLACPLILLLFVVLMAPRCMATISGDFNGDGISDCDDVDALSTEIIDGFGDLADDLTGDGIINRDDLDAWLAEAASENGLPSPYLPADATLDGVVDGGDFLFSWNPNKFTNNSAWCSGDFNTVGSVDGFDFNIWNAHKFLSSRPASRPPGDSTPDFYFDTTTGELSVDPDGLNIQSVLVTGPAAISLLDGGGAWPDSTGLGQSIIDGARFVNWDAEYFNGAQQWILLTDSDNTGIVSPSDIAIFAPDAFDGNSGLNVEYTTFNVGGPSILGVTALQFVPEPTASALLFAMPLMLLWRRGCSLN